MIRAQGVTFQVGDRLILQAIDVTIEPGTLTVVVGPNGAGKSTLAKLLSGELRPTDGGLMLDDKPLSKITAGELAARRAFVPQTTHLAFPFTVFEVVGLGISVPCFQTNRPDVQELVWEALDRVAMVSHAHRNFTTLSGGERQRVHFARALCQLLGSPQPLDASYLLLDEPTASLDIAHQLLLLDQCRALARSGVAVFAVLHDLNLAAAYSDQLLIMSGGRIVARGRAKDVLSDDLLSSVFDCNVATNAIPDAGIPFLLPQMCGLPVQRKPAFSATNAKHSK